MNITLPFLMVFSIIFPSLFVPSDASSSSSIGQRTLSASSSSNKQSSSSSSSSSQTVSVAALKQTISDLEAQIKAEERTMMTAGTREERKV